MMSEKLLIVDDDQSFRKLLRIALGYGKYVMHEAATAAEAIQMAQREAPDVMVLDISMPGDLDGLVACRRIRALPGCESTFIVLMTGQDRPHEVSQARDFGADAYMLKPFSPTRLIEVIEARHGRPKGEMTFVGAGR